MSWNEQHISDGYRKQYGEIGINYRKNWHGNIQERVLRMYPSHQYQDSRGRVSGYTPAFVKSERPPCSKAGEKTEVETVNINVLIRNYYNT